MIAWSRRLPDMFDLIVGVPRSGLLAASMLGLHLHKPVVDLSAFLAGAAPWSGLRLGSQGERSGGLRVLVVDDTVNSGTELSRVRAAVAQAPATRGARITYGAVYVAPGSQRLVDVFAEVLPLPRVFEWNVLHHEVVARSCMDIDGVLCADPKPNENDDGRRYRQFLSDTEIRYRPSVKIGTLVTSRLEKYRPETEAWLGKHGIEYGELVMLDLPSATERRRLQAHVPHKARAYLASDLDLFIESSLQEGEQIYRATGRPVFVTDTRDFFGAQPPAGHVGLKSLKARVGRAARRAIG